MTPHAAAFAIPGDIETLTGGYIYERRLLEGLRALGRDVTHIQLGASFPDPSVADMEDAVTQLAAIDPSRPLILDGLVFGSIATQGLAKVSAPIVAMIHHPLALESGLDPVRKEQLYRTERENLGLVGHVLVPSPHTKRILIEQYGVDAAGITIARPGTVQPSRPRDPVDPPLILSVGIQHPRKGHDVLLRALGRLPGSDWQAVIVGSRYDPDHAVELGQLHADLGLGTQVHLAGRVSADALSRLYAQAAVFVLATRYEGYGIVFDEALANGLPIVSCNTGAVPDTVPSDAGLLVPVGDADALADAMHRLLTDSALRRRVSDAALGHGWALPTWSETCRGVGTVLDRLVGGA
jgi:glycosyltransferase involved in cell wall biosynthesis